MKLEAAKFLVVIYFNIWFYIALNIFLSMELAL